MAPKNSFPATSTKNVPVSLAVKVSVLLRPLKLFPDATKPPELSRRLRNKSNAKIVSLVKTIE